jgi:hypothetical protein
MDEFIFRIYRIREKVVYFHCIYGFLVVPGYHILQLNFDAIGKKTMVVTRISFKKIQGRMTHRHVPYCTCTLRIHGGV